MARSIQGDKAKPNGKYDAAPLVRIVTLGCAKNEVDSQEIAGVLQSTGYQLSTDERNSVDLTIINTCGFLESAKKESIETIRKAVRTKGRGKVVVAGCLAQRMGSDLHRLTPGVDAYVGVGQMAAFAEIASDVLGTDLQRDFIDTPHHRYADVGQRLVDTRKWSAYLKVSEGCDHKCTFCTIPSFRGRHASKPIERVIQEAKHLVRMGAQEINLIAQDVTQYGFDLYQEFTLPRLLRELNEIEDLKWIRILYFYPNRLTDEVIETMATLPKVLPYIDIPLQHVDPEILRAMKRPWDGDRYLKLIEKVRGQIPEIAIRTTFIVGFPGEKESHFENLLSFVKEARLDRIGAFLFSREPGTPSYDMPDQVKTKVKQHRYERLMETQQPISLEINAGYIGKEVDVLVENCADGWFAGRSFRDAPEIDGYVYGQGQPELGSFVKVQVTEAQPYDLVGKLSTTSNVRMATRTNRLTSLPMARKAPL